MRTWVALFRGINVGGNSVLPMKDIVAILEDLGARDVGTYAQSGNAVFRTEETDAPSLSGMIGAAIEEGHGLEPRVLLLGPEELESAVRSNPFPGAESEPKTLHRYFLGSSPERPDLEALVRIKGDRECFVLGDGVLYLHTQDGVMRSKSAANAERLLGVPATARNWRTVRKVSETAKQRG